MNTIFVYGLLKPSFSLYHAAEPFVIRAVPATVRGRLYDADVPAARFDEDGTIEGFVFWLREDQLGEALTALDDLEDEGEIYRRITIEANTPDGTVEAFSYEYLKPLDGRPFVGSSWPA